MDGRREVGNGNRFVFDPGGARNGRGAWATPRPSLPCSRSSSDACPAAGCYTHPGFHHHATAVRRRDIRPNREERKFRWRVASAVAGALARPPGIRYSCDHVRAASREGPARNLQDCSENPLPLLPVSVCWLSVRARQVTGAMLLLWCWLRPALGCQPTERPGTAMATTSGPTPRASDGQATAKPWRARLRAAFLCPGFLSEIGRAHV